MDRKGTRVTMVTMGTTAKASSFFSFALSQSLTINADGRAGGRRTDGQTDGRTDGRKDGLKHKLMMMNATEVMVVVGVVINR